MTQHRDSGLQSWQDYVDFLRRRKRQIVIPFLVIFAVASAIAYLLPPVYCSTSTTLIESQQVPNDLNSYYSGRLCRTRLYAGPAYESGLYQPSDPDQVR